MKKNKILFLLLSLLLIIFTACNNINPEPKESLKFTSDYVLVDGEHELPLKIENILLENVSFEALDDSIAIIDGDVVKGLKPGSTTIIASYKNFIDEIEVYVFPTIANKLFVGDEQKINNSSEFNIISNNESVINYKEGILKVLSSGEAKLTISFVNNEDIKIEINIVAESKIQGFVPEFEKSEYIVKPQEEFYLGLVNCDGEDFNWFVEDESILIVFDDFYAQPMKTGTTTVTIVHKEDSSIKKTITVTVLPETPNVSFSSNKIVDGVPFDVEITNAYTVDELVVLFNEDELEMTIDNNKFVFKPLKQGEFNIKFALKENETVYIEKQVLVYQRKPLLTVSNTMLTLDDTVKLVVENYVDGYTVEIADKSVLSYEDGILKAIGVGKTTVDVFLDSDKTLSSNITIEVMPKMPLLSPVLENIKVGEQTGFIIENLEELSDTNFENYEFEVLDKDIATLEGNQVKGLKEGQAKIKVTLKTNPIVTSTTIINVLPVDTAKYIHLEATKDGILNAGDMYDFSIAGATDLTKYSWTTGNDKIALVNASGRVIAVNAGITHIYVYLKADPSIKTTLTVKVEGIPNVDYIGRIIKIAELELGYVEGPNNDTKYGDWYGLPNEEWCAMFVSWCAAESGLSTDVIPRYAGCTAGRQWFMDRNQYGARGEYTPKAGDVIFFRTGTATTGSTHTGLVINCDGTTVYTIEGNTSNCVAKRSYSINNTNIVGYGIPVYPAFDGEVSGGNTGGATDGSGESTT